LWVVTREEGRVERYLFAAAAKAGYTAYTWDCASGCCKANGDSAGLADTDIGNMLTVIGSRAQNARTTERAVFILRDLPPWLQGPLGITTVRQVRNLARMLPGVARDNAQALIVISPSSDVPPELAQHATLIEWPMPDREEIAALLDAAIDGLPEDMRAAAAPNGEREKALDAAIGLSGEEAQATYAKSLVLSRRIDPVAVAAEKRRIVKREGVLEWFDPLPGGLDAVGGLDGLKAWLLQRAGAFTKAAREYGLPPPRGVLLVGVSGCGKSLTAKAIATAWGVPLIRLDLGALKSKFVGESEGNLRKAFKVIEAIGRCVVWVDEIEKALAGATQGAADGGVSSDALGGLLSWMQERQGDAFVVATANNISQLPPELLRKGRFDELFFVDLPNAQERSEIIRATLQTYGRGREMSQMETQDVAARCVGFTGSECAEIVKDALYTAFADGGRAMRTVDMIAAAITVVPLSKTAGDKIKALQEWAASRARPATTKYTRAENMPRDQRQLDVA
jgi:MoxR-like ATPase